MPGHRAGPGPKAFHPPPQHDGSDVELEGEIAIFAVHFVPFPSRAHTLPPVAPWDRVPLGPG